MMLFYLTLYVLVIAGLAYWYSLKNSDDDFIIAGRNRPMWQIILSKAAGSVGVAFFLVYTGYTYQFGWSTALLLVFLAISFLVFAFWAVPKIYEHAHGKGFVTMGDFVGHRLESVRTGAFIDFITVGVGFIWVAAGFIGGTKVIANFVNISYVEALLVILVLIGGYVLLSGYRVVLITDVVQAVVIFGLIGMMIWTLGVSVDLTEVVKTSAEPLPIALLLGIAVFGFFSIFNSADRYQLIYSAKDVNSAKRGMAWGIVPFSLAFIPLIIIGLFMRAQNPGLDPDIVFLLFLNEFSSPSFLPFAGVMLVAGLMSTADTWIYAIASHFQNALNKWSKRNAQLDVFSIRKMVVVVMIAMGIFSFFYRELVTISILSAIVMASTSVSMLYIISNGKFAQRFVASSVLGILGAVGGVIVLGSIPEVLPIPVALSALGLLIPVSLLRKIQMIFERSA